MSRENKALSRRSFLRLAGLAVGGAVLAACAPQIIKETVVVEKQVEKEVTKVVKETVQVEKQVEVTKVVEKKVEVTKVVEKQGPKEVRIARCGWLESEMPFDLAIATYNNLPERKDDNVQIILDPAGKGATDPVLAQMMAAGEKIPWNAHACFTPFLETMAGISLETIQPFDPFLETSHYGDAAKRVKADMIGSVKEDNSYQGKLITIPTNVDVVCFMYRKDYLESVGANPPATMDEVLAIAKDVQKKLEKDKVFGFAPTPAVTWRYPAALHQAYSPADKLFTQDGLLNILDEGWLAAMEITKKFIDAGTVPQGWETWGYPENWKQGKVAMALNQHSMGTWGGMIWGYDKLAMMPTPPGSSAIQKSGTMFWATSIPLFKAAPYPQETTDFLVWLVDPDNEMWNRGAFKAGKMVGLKTPYTKYIDPNDVTQNWALGVLPLLEAATPPPPTKWYITEHTKIVPKMVEFLKGTKSATQAMQEAWDDIQAEIAKDKK